MTTLTSTLASAASENGATFLCAGCGETRPRLAPILKAAAALPFDLIQCAGCQLVQQHPRYSPAEISRLYEKRYYVFEEPDTHRWARAVQQYVVHLRPLERLPGRRILDIGCALGHMGAMASALGWKYTGLDISADAVSRASVRFRLDVRAGTLAQHAAVMHPFDVIFLGDVIEHVLDLRSFLAEIRKALSPDGLLCIDTPNWGSRWRRVFGRRWLGLNRYHINLLDEASARSMLESCGFAVDQIGSYTHYRYESLADRPEVQTLIGRLPGFMSWRANDWMRGLTPRSHWDILQTSAPSSIDHAVRQTSIIAAQLPLDLLNSTTRDNLVIRARRA